MAPEERPWRDRELLAAAAADWTRRLRGRRVAHLGGGEGWLWLVLPEPAAGPAAPPERDRPATHLVLTALPGAALCWDAPDPPPPPLRDALGRVPRRRLSVTPHLLDAALAGVALDPDDLVLELAWRRGEKTFHLRLQLFGARGNLALLDAGGRRLWSAHAGPHPALLRVRDAAGDTPAGAGAASAPDPAAAAARLREAAPRHLAAVLADRLHDRLAAALARRRATAERLVANLERDLARADGGERDRRLAETLAAHLHRVRRGQAAVELPGADGRPVTVPLDPAVPPHVNLERLFHRARKAERGRAVIAERLASARRAQAEAAALAADLAAVAGAGAAGGEREAGADLADDPLARLERLLAWRDAHPDLPAPPGRGPARRPAPPLTRPFRRYRLAGGWEVWVGRNDRENDELTHRAAAPDDWWLHAQSVPGSHVVLRARGRPDQVPRRVLEQAARLAALHSKARHAALVPVIYTLRKYVRKPRKSPPGTAACTREKSLMVEPGVPEGAETI